MNLLALILLLILSGCTTNQEIVEYKKSSDSSSYLQAAKFAQQKSESVLDNFLAKFGSEKSQKDLFWSLQAASAYRNAGHFKQSNKWFDIAEEAYKNFNENTFLDELSSGAGSMLAGDSALDYTGEIYEGILINTYKAMNFLALNDDKNARVEFNRASDRQRRALITFAEEIAAKDKELRKKSYIAQSINSSKATQQFNQRYSNLDKFKSYADFSNPYTTYMAGLFYALNGDKSKGLTHLKEAYAATQNAVIGQDLNALIDGNLDNFVWVIFENGSGISKDEFKINIPLQLAFGDIFYTGVAFPQLKFGKKALDKISVEGVDTAIFASMDGVIASEFKKDLPSIKARAIASAIIKTTLQLQLKKQDAMLGNIFALYQAVSTRADVRIWSSLPKEFQVARVSMPADGLLKLTINNKPHRVKITQANSAIVTVKLPTRLAKPAISVAKFK
jgi:hypothetical protein